MRNRTGTRTQAAQTLPASAASPIVGHSRSRVAATWLVSGSILERTGGTVWVTQTVSSNATPAPGQRSTVMEATISSVAGSTRKTVPLSAPTTALETQIAPAPAERPVGSATNSGGGGPRREGAVPPLVRGWGRGDRA